MSDNNFGGSQFLNNPYMDNSPIKQRFPNTSNNNNSS
jgi:hypothetical protein